ncbi:MAG: 2-phosphosulfolactate phosphatase [Candidatus Zixiibacteriota bacterium]
MKIDLYLIPGPVEPDKLANRSLVLIDVLRASTTICQSLFAGAKAVIPVEQPGEAAELRNKIGIEDTILGGERKGLKIDNFDLGNSPREYTAPMVKNKTVILTTSNGTKTYSRSKYASLTMTAGLVNINRVFDRIIEEKRDVAIICAGNDGDFSIEDTLCGGMLIDLLRENNKSGIELNDSAELAALLYGTNRNRLKEAIKSGKHGSYLARIGFGEDVDIASNPNSIPVLPVYMNNRIVSE